MKINDIKQYNIKRMNRNFSGFLKKDESNDIINSNLYNQLKNIKMNEKDNYYKEMIKKNNYSFYISKKIMKSLLTTMNKNTPRALNSLNSVNFIYQIYEKGIDIVNHKNKNKNRSVDIQNCLNNKKYLINNNSLNGGENNEIFENLNLSFFNKEKNLKAMSTNNKLLKNDFSMMNKNYNNFINKRKFNKYKILNNLSSRIILKRSSSCKPHENQKYLSKERKRILSSKYSTQNNSKNFALLPIKNILNKFQNNEQLLSMNNRNIKSSNMKKQKYFLQKENQLTLKLFKEKYEKEKENFNNILFDECIELRKKKFKLESFIKRFTNMNFIEKLYKSREYSLKKSICH